MSPVPTETRRRSAHRTALLSAVQVSKGTAVTDFSSARNLWAGEVSLNPGLVRTDPRYMTADSFDTGSSDLIKTRRPIMTFASIATPQTVEHVLRGNWGPFAGGAFTLASAVNEWLSLVYVEDRTGAEQGNALRLTDAWPHRVAFVTRPGDGLLRMEVEAAARRIDILDLADEPPPLVLPAPPMGPSDSARFLADTTRIVLDPSGLAEELDYSDLRVEISQGLVFEWTMTSGMDVRKGGKPSVTISFNARVNDESWGRVIDALGNVQPAVLVDCLVPGGALEIEFARVAWETPEAIGFGGRAMRRLALTGRARLDGTDGVDIRLRSA